MKPAATPVSPVPFGWAIVTGNSMAPTLSAGDRLVVRYRRLPRAGQIVVARLPDGVIVVKRAVERRTTGWWLLSDHPDEGVDSRHRGPIADDDILGVVLGRVWPRPGRIDSKPAVI